MQTPQAAEAFKKLQDQIKPGDVNAQTTDDEINARARVYGHQLGVPVVVMAHLFKLDRRIAILETKQPS